MTDPIATFRSMLARSVPLDDALLPYLGVTQWDANRCADAAETGDGLSTSRLRGLVTLLALREAPPALAMLAAALVWRSAPVATTTDELNEAIVRICLWRGGMTDEDVWRICQAHRTCAVRVEEALARTGRAEGPEIDVILEKLCKNCAGDHVVAELGSSLLIVHMTDAGYFVGLQDERDAFVVIDRVPHAGGGDEGPEPEEDPAGPRPSILLDA